ncbi:hypothetical protein DFQ28_004454, partial [Apophysomyces sp. BC1034]
MRALRESGVHMYGFGLTSAIRAYKIFVRPIIEYGVALCNLTAVTVQPLENTQKQCLRMCLRRKHTSPVGTIQIASLAGLPTMYSRYQILQAKFIKRAYSLPSGTLLKTMLPDIAAFRSPYAWSKIRLNAIWRVSLRLQRSPEPPKDCLMRAIVDHLQE